MAVSKRLRMEVFRRDNHACRYCGAAAPEVKITIDHVVPVALGGRDEPGNLVTACSDCNSGKSSLNPGSAVVEDVHADALRWGRAMEEAAEQRRRDRLDFKDDCRKFDVAWTAWGYDSPAGRQTIDRDDNWEDSLRRWMVAGVELDELIDLIPVAMRSKARADETWRYFCGCAWRAVTETQELAKDFAEQDLEYDQYFAEQAAKQAEVEEFWALADPVIRSWFRAGA